MAAEAAASNAPEDRPPHPFVHASPLSKLLFIWPYSLMNKTHPDGTKHTIQETDLPDVLPDDSSKLNLEGFQDMWNEEKARAAKAMERYEHQNRNRKSKKPLDVPRSAYPSLRRALVRDFLKTLWFVQPIMGLAAVCKMAQAVALGYLLQSFEEENGNGYLWAGVMVGTGFVVLMEHHHVFFWTWRRG